MKKSLLTLTLILSPLASFASSTIFCQGLTDSDKTLLLFVNENKIAQVRVQTQGSLPKAFAAHEVRVQEDVALYSLTGISQLMEVQTSVLDGNGGWLNLSNEKFDCDAN